MQLSNLLQTPIEITVFGVMGVTIAAYCHDGIASGHQKGMQQVRFDCG